MPSCAIGILYSSPMVHGVSHLRTYCRPRISLPCNHDQRKQVLSLLIPVFHSTHRTFQEMTFRKKYPSLQTFQTFLLLKGFFVSRLLKSDSYCNAPCLLY